MSADHAIPLLILSAWLLPLGGGVVAWGVGHRLSRRTSRLPGWVAIGTIGASFLLSGLACVIGWQADRPLLLTAPLYPIYRSANLSINVDYAIDSLTLVMFAMVTLVATCIHLFALRYMADECTLTYHDHEIEDRAAGSGHVAALHADVDHGTTAAQRFVRPGRLHRFYALMQLFCFAMLGLILSGNLWQIFLFWELVGAASYFLIGFYAERPYAARAASKAFVMNRVGDAGFLIGMAAFLTLAGTLSLHNEQSQRDPHSLHSSATERASERQLPLAKVNDLPARPEQSDSLIAPPARAVSVPHGAPRWWLIVGGLGLVAGCLGKSAQLPLATWLPDAMAGPTPVSALVHSATMVAAGVYLLGRIAPLLLPEVLLVVAYVGGGTLLYGAVCAMVQTDLKRILAYSTISQLGYMTLAIGVGGRDAGLFHLITHAFFKSLLFLTAGSVIIACQHVQDLRRLGGLRRQLPVTAWTSLVGVLAIGGLAIPLVKPLGETLAFSGYHSKDSILAAALAFTRLHTQHGLLFALPLLTAGLTAFYMLRFWLLTFAGRHRDELLARKAREHSWFLKGPLLILALFAAGVAIGGTHGPLFRAIEASTLADYGPEGWPRESFIDAHHDASWWGLAAATLGGLAALMFYALGLMEPRPISASAGVVRGFLLTGGHLDRVYRWLFVSPVRLLGWLVSLIDRFAIDGMVRFVTAATLWVARIDRAFDERFVDGLVRQVAQFTCRAGGGLQQIQTGQLRQYVMAFAAAVVALFALTVILFPY